MTAYIYDAVRTPRGKASEKGGLAALTPHELVKQSIDAIAERGATDGVEPDALLLGCVGQVGSQGGNVALPSKFHSGLPDRTNAYTINNYCVSGLTAIGMAADQVNARGSDCVYAGGVEMMSQVGFMADRASYYGDMSFPERSRYIPVVLAADRLAETENITRAQMDEVTLTSHQRAHAAQDDAAFQKSRIKVVSGDGDAALTQDECVRGQTSVESLQAMEPAFAELAASQAEALGSSTFASSHTIAHAPPVCDGAGMALIGKEKLADLIPRARILAFAECGGDPMESLTTGLTAMEKVLAQTGLDLSQIDRIEFMEAFAVTIAKFMRDYSPDPSKLNASGGHLAKGHPLGASGAILTSTLLDCLDQADGNLGMVVAAGAGGIGTAMIVERLN